MALQRLAGCLCDSDHALAGASRRNGGCWEQWARRAFENGSGGRAASGRTHGATVLPVPPTASRQFGIRIGNEHRADHRKAEQQQQQAGNPAPHCPIVLPLPLGSKWNPMRPLKAVAILGLEANWKSNSEFWWKAAQQRSELPTDMSPK
jgi:hypothetical protein